MNAAPEGDSAANVAEAVAHKLRLQIADGEFAIGSALPPEHQLMESLGVSRPTCREALRILQSEGLIRVQRGKQGGAIIRPPDPARIAEYAGMYLRMRGSSIGEVYEARILVEPAIVAELAVSPDREMLSTLSQMVAAERWLIRDRPRYYAATREFRNVLIGACTNEPLRLIALMMGQIADYQLTRLSHELEHYAGEEERHLEAMTQKSLMIEAMAANRSKEAAAMWGQYLRFYSSLLAEHLAGDVARHFGLARR